MSKQNTVLSTGNLQCISAVTPKITDLEWDTELLLSDIVIPDSLITQSSELIVLAAAGGEIVLGATTFSASNVSFDNDASVIGQGINKTMIQGFGTIDIDANVSFQNITFQNCSLNIQTGRYVTFQNCRFTGMETNKTNMYVRSYTKIVDCIFDFNYGGYIFITLVGGVLSLINSQIRNNFVSQYLIANSLGTLNISESFFSNNINNTAVIHANSGIVQVSHCNFESSGNIVVQGLNDTYILLTGNISDANLLIDNVDTNNGVITANKFNQVRLASFNGTYTNNLAIGGVTVVEKGVTGNCIIKDCQGLVTMTNTSENTAAQTGAASIDVELSNLVNTFPTLYTSRINIVAADAGQGVSLPAINVRSVGTTIVIVNSNPRTVTIQGGTVDFTSITLAEGEYSVINWDGYLWKVFDEGTGTVI